MVEDGEYFYRRAEAELKLAERAHHPDAVKAHYELANLHLDRASDLDQDRATAKLN